MHDVSIYDRNIDILEFLFDLQSQAANERCEVALCQMQEKNAQLQQIQVLL